MSAAELAIPIVGATTAVIASYVTRRLERDRAESNANARAARLHGESRAALEQARASAAHNERALRDEVALWRRIVGAAPAEVGAGRLRAREAEELVRRVRGLARLDGVVVTDADGLALTRAQHALEARLAVCANVLDALGPTRGLIRACGFVARSHLHVEVRALPAFANGSALIAATMGDAPPAYALDAAVALAETLRSPMTLGGTDPPAAMIGQTLFAVDAPSHATLAPELSHACASLGLGAAAIVSGERVFIATGQDAPGIETLRGAAKAIDAAVTQLASAMHESIDRFWVRLGDRLVIGSDDAGNDSGARLLTISRRAPLQDAELARVLGALRRARAFATLGQEEAA